MNPDEIKHLKKLVNFGLMWRSGEDEYKLVKTIRKYEDEPSECAFLSNGNYVALYNTEPKEFFTISYAF